MIETVAHLVEGYPLLHQRSTSYKVIIWTLIVPRFARSSLKLMGFGGCRLVIGNPAPALKVLSPKLI